MNRTNVLHTIPTVTICYGSQIQGLLPRGCYFLHEADQIDLLFEGGQSKLSKWDRTDYHGGLDVVGCNVIMTVWLDIAYHNEMGIYDGRL